MASMQQGHQQGEIRRRLTRWGRWDGLGCRSAAGGAAEGSLRCCTARAGSGARVGTSRGALSGARPLRVVPGLRVLGVCWPRCASRSNSLGPARLWLAGRRPSRRAGRGCPTGFCWRDLSELSLDPVDAVLSATASRRARRGAPRRTRASEWRPEVRRTRARERRRSCPRRRRASDRSVAPVRRCGAVAGRGVSGAENSVETQSVADGAVSSSGCSHSAASRSSSFLGRFVFTAISMRCRR